MKIWWDKTRRKTYVAQQDFVDVSQIVHAASFLLQIVTVPRVKTGNAVLQLSRVDVLEARRSDVSGGARVQAEPDGAVVISQFGDVAKVTWVIKTEL